MRGAHRREGQTYKVRELMRAVYANSWFRRSDEGGVAHSGESNVHGREVGGILVGHRCQRRNENHREEYSLSVTDVIPVRSFDNSNAHLSFTEDEWGRAESDLGQKYRPQGKCRLGWYHT